MSKKLAIEEVKEIFTKAKLSVLENEPKGVDYKYKCIDSEGYLFSRSVHSLQKNLREHTKDCSHAFSIKNPYFYNNMNHYIELNVNNGTVLLTKKDEITSAKQMLKFRCGICGREYNSTWHNFIKIGNKVCNFCFHQLKSKGEVGTKHQDTNKFHLAAIKNSMAILSGPDIKYHDKVLVQDKEGYKGFIIVENLLKGSSFEKFAKINPYTIDNMRIYALHKGWDCVIYNQEYKGDKSPIQILCSCGNNFETDITHFIQGKCRCNECRVKQSAIAQSVELWLNQNGVEYEKEKTFNKCFNKKKLPFDFFLPKYNACIEVDGLGHYRPVAFSGDKEKAKTTFKERVYNDSIKTAFCKEHNIPLLRLPYWVIEKEEHKECIKNFILSIEPNELNK